MPYTRSKSIMLLVFSILFAASLAEAADETLFREDIRIEVAKITLNRSFTANGGQEAKIVITNGPDGQPASSLKVILNGKAIVTRKQVNRNITTYTGTGLVLLKKNILRIIAKKNPGRVVVEIQTAEGGGGDPDTSGLFNRVIGYGDSLLAGFMDGTLVEHMQGWNFGSQVSKQANAKFVLPLIARPGLPTQRVGIVNGFIDVLPDAPPGGRSNQGETLNNFAVPGASVAASLLLKSLNGDPAEDIYSIILGGNRTLLQSVTSRNPTLVLLWIGSNDVLDMIMSADPNDHTNLADFSRDYETILKELKKKTNRIVAANIPDITTVAFLIDPNNAPIFGAYIGLLNLPAGSRITAAYLLDIVLSLSTRKPREDELLLADELPVIRNTVIEFNAEIARLCAQYGVPLIDMYAESQNWQSNGIMAGGRNLKTTFLGGMFSLDGLHPSMTTHAVIANIFIQRINSEYGTDLPSVNVDEVYAQDPLRTLAASRISLSDEVVVEALEAIGDYRALLRATREAAREARDQAIVR